MMTIFCLNKVLGWGRCVVGSGRSVQAGVFRLPAARLTGADGISAWRPARGSQPYPQQAVRRDQGSWQPARRGRLVMFLLSVGSSFSALESHHEGSVESAGSCLHFCWYHLLPCCLYRRWKATAKGVRERYPFTQIRQDWMTSMTGHFSSWFEEGSAAISPQDSWGSSGKNNNSLMALYTACHNIARLALFFFYRLLACLLFF